MSPLTQVRSISLPKARTTPHGLLTAPATWLLAPALLFLVVFLMAPLAGVLQLSFFTHSATGLWLRELTTVNYLQAFDSYYAHIFVRSIRIAGLSTLFCVILGFPLAYYLARCSPRALSIGLFLLIVPLMVSTVIRAFGWFIIIGKNGLINQALRGVSPDLWIDVIYTETAVIIGLVQLVLPMMVLPLMASIETIPMEVEEAGFNLGCGAWSLFRKVLLPLSTQGLISGSILCFSVSISVVVTSQLLGGRWGRMIGNEIYDQVITGLNWPFASALSISLIGGLLALFAISAVIRRSLVAAGKGRADAAG